MPPLCHAWTAAQERPDSSHFLVSLRCKSWQCPPCADTNRRRLTHRLTEAQPTHLITLTCRRTAYPDPYTAARALSLAIPHLFKRLKRRFPAALTQYLLVWETTRTGWPHAHLLCRTSYLPQRVLSRHWAELTQSPVVDIRRVSHPAHAAAYLAKYLTKQAYIPYNLRKFRTSRLFWPGGGGFFAPRRTDRTPWRIIPTTLEAALLDYPSISFWHIPLSPTAVLAVPRSPPDTHLLPWI